MATKSRKTKHPPHILFYTFLAGNFNREIFCFGRGAGKKAGGEAVSRLPVMLGDFGKHLHQSRAEGEDGFDVQIGAAAGIEQDCEL